MTGNIFINYRRGDDPGFTQALYSRLEQAFRLSGCYGGILPIAAQSGWVTAAWSYFNDVLAIERPASCSPAWSFFRLWRFSCLPFGDLPLARLTELAELAGYLIGIAYMLYVAVPLIQAPQST